MSTTINLLFDSMRELAANFTFSMLYLSFNLSSSHFFFLSMRASSRISRVPSSSLSMSPFDFSFLSFYNLPLYLRYHVRYLFSTSLYASKRVGTSPAKACIAVRYLSVSSKTDMPENFFFSYSNSKRSLSASLIITAIPVKHF